MNLIEAEEQQRNPRSKMRDPAEAINAMPLPAGGRRSEATVGIKALLDLVNDPELELVKDAAPLTAPEAVTPAPRRIVASEPVQASAPQPTKVVFPARIYATGRLKAGKDHLLKALGCQIEGFADPLYALQKLFFGSDDKSLPGAREFLQRVGQWGRGLVSDKYPLSVERATFVTMIRTMGPAGLIPRDLGVDWEQFGKTDSLWIEALSKRIKFEAASSVSPRIGVSNVRFENEVRAMNGAGFTGFHVLCSQKTWEKRIRAAGMDPKNPALTDTSEQLAIGIEKAVAATIRKEPRGPKLRVVWNDPEVSCPSPRFITLADVEAGK